MIISYRKLSPVSEYPFPLLSSACHWTFKWKIFVCPVIDCFKLIAPSRFSEKNAGRETNHHVYHWEVGPCCHSRGRNVELACPTSLKKYAISRLQNFTAIIHSLMQDTHRLLHMKFGTVFWNTEFVYLCCQDAEAQNSYQSLKYKR